MEQVNIIGLDLAKRTFQLHGSHSNGGVAFRKKVSRDKVLTFLSEQPRCVVAMEACGSAHHWGRAIRDVGHEVRLIPPVYVKPFVKRQKNDAADAEAIAEAASRPTMRFVAVKTEEQQARAMLFRTRDLLVRQRTQLINALRGHLAEFGVVAPQGPANLTAPLPGSGGARNVSAASRRRTGAHLSRSDRAAVEKDRRTRKGDSSRSRAGDDDPTLADDAGRGADHRHGDRDLRAADGGLQAWARLRRLARSRPPPAFDRRQTDLGKTSKMGQRDIRRLLIIGAMAVVRWASAKESRRQRGSIACWRASRGCSWQSRWRTRWPARSGRC